MSRCQCLTKEGKGPQCTREVQGIQQFCWQHQDCKTPVDEASSVKQVTKKPPPKKIINRQESSLTNKFDTYFDIVPRELIDELLFLIPLPDLEVIQIIFSKYLTKQWWIRRLMIITKLPRESLIDVNNDPDLRHIINFVKSADEIKRNINGPLYWSPSVEGPDFYRLLYELSLKFGYVSILQYIDENNLMRSQYSVDYLTYYNIKDNPQAIIEYLEPRGFNINKYDNMIMRTAIRDNNYLLIKYLIERDIPINKHDLTSILYDDSLNFELIDLFVAILGLKPIQFMSIIPTTTKTNIKKLINYAFTLPDPEKKSKEEIVFSTVHDVYYNPKLFDYLLSLNLINEDQLTTIALEALDAKNYHKFLYLKRHGANISDDVVKDIFNNLINGDIVMEREIMTFIDSGELDLNKVLITIDEKIKALDEHVYKRKIKALNRLRNYVAKKIAKK